MSKLFLKEFSMPGHVSRGQNVVNLFAFIREQDNPPLSLAHSIGEMNLSYHSGKYTQDEMKNTDWLNQSLSLDVKAVQGRCGVFTQFNASERLRPALVRHGYDGYIISGNHEPIYCWYFPLWLANNRSQRAFQSAYESNKPALISSLLNNELFKRAYWHQTHKMYSPICIVAHDWWNGSTYYYDPNLGKGLIIETRLKMNVAIGALITAFFTQRQVQEWVL